MRNIVRLALMMVAVFVISGSLGAYAQETPTAIPETPTATPEPVVETPTATPEPVVETPTATPEPVEETPTSTPEPVEETPTATSTEVPPPPTSTPVVESPTATPEPVETPTATPEPVLPTPTSTPSGDVSGDGQLGVDDAESILDIVGGNTEGLTEEQIKNADLTQDGEVTAADAQAVYERMLEQGLIP